MPNVNFDSYSKGKFDGVKMNWDFTGDKVKKLSRNRGGSLVDLVAKSDPVIRPTLVLSIGGLGGNTLNEIKKKFIERVKPQIPGQEMVLFAELDTDQGWMDNLKEDATGNGESDGFMERSEQINIVNDLSPNVQNIVDMAQNHPNLPQHEWIDKKIPKKMLVTTSGCGATRQMGRLALSAGNNYENLLSKIENKLRILQTKAPVVEHTQTINVILIAGISGGTGSGSIIDVTYLLHLASQNVGALHLDIDAILYTPDVQENVPNIASKDNLKRNFTACMKEIDNFFQAKDTEEEYRFKSSKFPGGILTTASGGIVGNSQSIFRSVTLVQGYNAAGQVLDIAVPTNTVSNYVVSLLCKMNLVDAQGMPTTLIESVYNNEMSVGTNVSNVLNSNAMLPRDTYYDYRTIGYHDVTFPIEAIMTVVANHVLSALHKEYQKDPSMSGIQVLSEIAGIYPIVNCLELGNNNIGTINSIRGVTKSNMEVRDIKEFNVNNIDNHCNVGAYAYDNTWVNDIYDKIVNAINNELNNTGPYAALRLSQEICTVLEMELEENTISQNKKTLAGMANTCRANVTAAADNIKKTTFAGLGAKLGNNKIRDQINNFVTNLRNYDVARWKLNVYDQCMNAVAALHNNLVKQHNDVFERYVGAFLAINEILETDATGIVKADYSGNTFSASLLNPADLKNDNSRLYDLIRHCIKPENIQKLSKDFIQSMLNKQGGWTSKNNANFDAVNEFKSIFKVYFTEFQENVIQKFMVIKYTDKLYTNDVEVKTDELLDVLDQYIQDKNQHPDPWSDFEQYCQSNYGVQPLHKAAEAILNEALSIGYCAKEEDGIGNAGISFDNFPDYKLLCLMKSTPDINNIIKGDPANNVPPLLAYSNWCANGGKDAEADISSVICMKVVYKLPLYIFKGFKHDQEIYYNAVTSGAAHDAGLHMDSSTERPWTDFPQIVNSDSIRLLENGKINSRTRKDYQYEIGMLTKIKEQADNCLLEKNNMIHQENPGDTFYTLYYLNESYKDSWVNWHKNLIANFENDINNAINTISDIDIKKPEEDWNAKFKAAMVNKSLYQRLKEAQYEVSDRKLHETCCYLNSAEMDTDNFEDDQDASKGGLYKVIRRSTRSRMILAETYQLCNELNKELIDIKEELTKASRETMVKAAKDAAAQQELLIQKAEHKDKLQRFFDALIVGLLRINNNKLGKTITVTIDKKLNGGFDQVFEPVNYLRSPAIEKENILYAVFTTMFLHYNKDNTSWWSNFEEGLQQALAEISDYTPLSEKYTELSNEYIPLTDPTYFPNNVHEAINYVKVLDSKLDTANQTPVFEKFGDTKLSIDDLPAFRGAPQPFGFSIGSQLVKFYHDIIDAANTYGLKML